MNVDARYVVEPARGLDIDAWLQSLAVQAEDNGEDGVYFSPRSRHEAPPSRAPENVLGYVARLTRPLTEPGWFRLWLLREASTRAIVGHADLSGGRLQAELHRASLGMGITRAHRGVGQGQRLLEAVIAWARDEAGLSWIELGVFHCNPRAQRLYRRCGFVEAGRVPDCFRVDGVVIDDIRMVLRLR